MPTFRGHRESDDGRPPSATTRAYEHLKDAVVTCRLVPGQAVFEGELAEELGMSKTPVREALGMLAHEGFVEVQPRRGYRVTQVTLDDVRELYHLRQLLEPAAVELAAANATQDQLTRLRALATHSREHDYAGRVRHAHLFHQVLAEACGSRRLGEQLLGVLDECRRLYFLDGVDLAGRIDHSGDEHVAVLDALDAGQGERAAELAGQQVLATRDAVLSAIGSSLTAPTPGATDGPVVPLHHR